MDLTSEKGTFRYFLHLAILVIFVLLKCFCLKIHLRMDVAPGAISWTNRWISLVGMKCKLLYTSPRPEIQPNLIHL